MESTVGSFHRWSMKVVGLEQLSKALELSSKLVEALVWCWTGSDLGTTRSVELGRLNFAKGA